jgi:hypothetical protein
MSLDLPKVTAKPQVDEDWRAKLVETASLAGSRIESRERARNPMIPDNFMDLSDSGFPADLIVICVQIPRQDVPAEMAQYRDLLNLQWLHLPFSAISMSGGQDGKADVPGAVRIDLGGGNFVAGLAGHYLMFANRHQYEERRARNVRRHQESAAAKMEAREELIEGMSKGKYRFDSTDTGPMTVEELFEYEKSIGDEAPIMGARLT